MVHRKGYLEMDNQWPHNFLITNSTQGTESPEIDKGSIKSHITIIAEIPEIIWASSTQCNWGY